MNNIPEFLLRKYDAVEFVDEGQFGAVYKCEYSGMESAVKVLRAFDKETLTRFDREIKISKEIKHENLLEIIDSGITDGYHWYESEYADSEHFGKACSYIFYTNDDRVKCFRQICLGLQALHENKPQIIHRDIKPRNILVFSSINEYNDHTLKIADFGIAKILDNPTGFTKSNILLGTQDYVAPERKKNPRLANVWSDIYSLGITFFEVCTGSTNPTPENFNLLPKILRPIIEKMTMENPLHRYNSVTEILEAFAALSHFELIHDRPQFENETHATSVHINIGREIENIWDLLLKSNEENILENVATFERILNRLVNATGHEAHSIMSIKGPVLGVIDKANPNALSQLVQRFLNVAEKVTERDFYSPEPHNWSAYLADVFKYTSLTGLKETSLEGLVKFLERFKTFGTAERLFATILIIEDPDLMRYLAICLREADFDDIAILLDNVPEERSLDKEALKTVLISKIIN